MCISAQDTLQSILSLVENAVNLALPLHGPLLISDAVGVLETIHNLPPVQGGPSPPPPLLNDEDPAEFKLNSPLSLQQLEPKVLESLTAGVSPTLLLLRDVEPTQAEPNACPQPPQPESLREAESPPEVLRGGDLAETQLPPTPQQPLQPMQLVAPDSSIQRGTDTPSVSKPMQLQSSQPEAINVTGGHTSRCTPSAERCAGRGATQSAATASTV